MRITNNIITTKAGTNINSTKVTVDKENTQMTTQKAIDRPSDDPVIAVRSLRLSTELSKVNQYYKKNIPDAESWLDVTETALKNMKDIVKDVHTLSVQGSNGDLTAENRNTILSQLQALQNQLYSEGNSDSAGRTVFTGYRTNKTLTFMTDEPKTSYSITQRLNVNDAMEEYRYYSHEVTVPATNAEIEATDSIPRVEESVYTRMRLAYNDIAGLDTMTDENGTEQPNSIHITGTDPDTTKSAADRQIDTYQPVTVYDDEDAWLNASTANPKKKTVGDDEIIFVKSTGEFIFGDTIASQLKSEDAEIRVDYTKTGFNTGELRPEYYYDCTDKTDPANPVDFQKYELNPETGKYEKKTYEIDYTIAANQTLAVNIEADEVFDSSMIQDVDDMITAVTNAINAHDKVDKIDEMMTEDRYASYTDQLKQWREAAQREADYADDHMQKVYNKNIGRSDGYLEEITLATTKLGCKADQLDLTKKRMSDQQQTVQELQSKNDDVDLSDVVLKFTSAYTAYQASLTAAGRLGKLSLLNYI